MTHLGTFHIYKHTTKNHATCHPHVTLSVLHREAWIGDCFWMLKRNIYPPDIISDTVETTFRSLWISEMFRRRIHNQRHCLLAQCSNISLLNNSFTVLPCLYFVNIYCLFFFKTIAPMSSIKFNKTSGHPGNKWCKVNLKLKYFS